MNKRHLRHLLKQTRLIKVRYLLIGFVFSSALAVWALRQNNLGMVQRLQAVIEADKSGEGVDQALRELGNYVTKHMNASLPNNKPVELEKSYERAVLEAYKQAEATANGDIYKEAQKKCEDPYVLLAVRAQCIQDFVTKNSKPGQEPQPVQLPAKEQYSYNFVSPVFSFDLAGWSILISAFFLLSAFFVKLAEKLLEYQLKN